MKKSVIILIGIIYAASIMLVTFYGLVTEEPPTDFVPVKWLEIIGDEITTSSGEKHIILDAPLTATEGLTYQISYTLDPADATNKTVIYETSETYAAVDENGLVTITGFDDASGYNVVTVTVYATDDDGNKNTAITDILNIWYTVNQ